MDEPPVQKRIKTQHDHFGDHESTIMVPINCFGSHMVVINTGGPPNVSSTIIHEGVLRHFSSYFNKALRSPMSESQTLTFDLDDEPDVIQAMHCFIYTGRICSDRQRRLAWAADARDAFYSLNARVWIFGDKRGMPELQDEAINEILRFWFTSRKHFRVSAAVIDYIYANTLPSAALRELVVALLIYDHESYNGLHDELLVLDDEEFVFHHGFISDCLHGFLEKVENNQDGQVVYPSVVNLSVFNPSIFNPGVVNPGVVNPSVVNPSVVRTEGHWFKRRCDFHVHGYKERRTAEGIEY